MRVAQVAPLFEDVPPRRYGGTERIIATLCDELVRLGHEVTLFASEGSHTAARLEPCGEALRLAGRMAETPAAHARLFERVLERQDEFDLIHFHTELLHLDLAGALRVPSLTTMHGRVDAPTTTCALAGRTHAPLVAISESQRRGCAQAHWRATVHHGLPPEDFTPGGGGPGLAFVGRFSRDKRADRAIRIARAAGLPLRIAAKFAPDDAAWFEQVLEPLLSEPGVENLGEVDQHEKVRLLGQARALVFPIDWPEPFGLVMIEALACGTPVVAWRCGAAPEVIEHGVTGFLVESEAEAVAACRHAAELDRDACRRAYLTRFTAARMAAAYLATYRDLVAPDRVRAHAAGDLHP